MQSEQGFIKNIDYNSKTGICNVSQRSAGCGQRDHWNAQGVECLLRPKGAKIREEKETKMLHNSERVKWPFGCNAGGDF